MTDGDLEQRADEQGRMLANRLRKRSKHLRRWARRSGVTCYRLYDRDIPELPLVVDWYDGRLHIGHRAGAATREASPEQVDAWLETLASAAAEALGVGRGEVFLKRRDRQRGRSQYERVAKVGARYAVEEGPCRFWVNLSDYLDTGLFLDHRPTRAMVGAAAAGKRVLNLYCYTGAFTVHAARGGAASTTSVDMSRTYLDWARDNFRLNDLDDRHLLIRADVERYIDDALAGRDRFDLVVVDPPTFSNSKRMERSFDVQRDHPALLERVLDLTAPGGSVYFSTNARRFRLDQRCLGGARVEDISEATIPPDFRDTRAHKCFRILRP